MGTLEALASTNYKLQLEIDTRDGEVNIIELPEWVNGVPVCVANGVVRRFDLPGIVDSTPYCELTDELGPLLDELLDECSEEWNGSDYVCSATERGQELLDEICQLVEERANGLMGDWCISPAVGYLDDSAVPVRHDMTDDELGTLVDELEEAALENCVVLTHVYEYLKDARAYAQFAVVENEE